jgi:probable F420-dependent oxidoreductase
VKVRIGIGAGGGASPAELGRDIVELGFDSLWLPEILSQPGPDPLVGLAYAAAENPRLKIGTTMLLPGRNLVRLAKQVATLDALSKGRFLLTFVPGIPRGAERAAVGVDPKQRGALMDEMLPVLRQLWSGQSVSHHGVTADFDDLSVLPRPVQDPFEVWLGGTAPAALSRCGRLADGWLPAMCTPEDAAAGRVVIDAVAAEHGRSISPEHFGMSIGYSHQAIDEAVVKRLAPRTNGRPLGELIPVGLPALRQLLEEFIGVGFTKFVLRPLQAPSSWRNELEDLAKSVADLQT